MDRRRLQSRNALRKQLHSSSQTTIGSDLVKENVVRSASAVDNRLLSRKRKSSKDTDEDKSTSMIESFSRMSESARKKTRNAIIDDDDDDDKNDDKIEDDDDDDDETEDNVLRLSESMRNSEKEQSSIFTKLNKTTENFKKKLKNNSSDDDIIEDDDDEGDDNKQKNDNLNSQSYVRGFLEALDKNPSKSSQSSNTSVDKYGKPNCRSSARSRRQQSALKATFDRYKEKASQNSQESFSQSRISKLSLRNNSRQQKSKNESVLNYSVDTDISAIENNVEKSFFNNDISPIKNLTDESKNKTLQKTSTSTQEHKSIHEMFVTKRLNYRKRNDKLQELRNFEIDEIKEDCLHTNKSRNKPNENYDKFTDFINEVGITLFAGDNLHIANDDPREVIQKMKSLLDSNKFEVDEIINSWNNYITDEENLKKSLLEMKVETDEGIGISSKALSLSRFLLQVPQLQIKVFESLFTKLIDAVITSDSSDDVPWAVLMIQQFRFLEILVDLDFLIKKIEELLSSSPEWFQREVIVFIPDIVADTHHFTTSEMLVNIMKNNNNLTYIILDCIHNLILSTEYKEELRENILKLLNNKIEKNALPSITRFVLDGCPTEAIALKSLNALRLVDMTASVERETDECYTNQTFIINAMKISMQLFKEVSQASLTIIKDCKSEAVPLDIIILILIYETITVKKKVVESTLSCHIKDGCYKTSLLDEFYTGYKQVAKGFQSTAINLAMNLLRADNSVLVEFGIEWARNIFVSQSDATYKQREILEKLLNLMGNKDKTVKNALEVLSRMANSEKERKYFQHHVGFLRCFLEKIDNLQFDEVATLYHLFHGLCTQSELISNTLNDDLTIIMQKQLCSSKVITKCKGVLGAVMAIKHLAINNETSGEAYELLKRTLCNLRSCIRSQALFYDQLAEIIINTSGISSQFLSHITNFFEDNFINNCLVETSSDDSLVPKFGLNDTTMVDSYHVNFGNGKTGMSVPVFLKLLRICNLRLSGSLESINAVLGCSVLMPQDLSIPEPSTADYMVHCINWFRELIGGFVTQEEVLLREQVLKRLHSLMNLQGELVTMMSMCESRYQPPACYFHTFPTPQFVRIDMKLGKKGNKKGRKRKNKKKEKDDDKDDDNDDDKEDDKENDKTDLALNKSVLLPEWENWVIGSELTIKNPTFFRQMDAKIINLLDTNMDINSSQVSSENITVAQVCFIIKEILGIFKNQSSESLVKDLIQSLPKICAKLQQIVTDLRNYERAHEKEAVQLLLCLFITLFSWDEFKNPKYNTLLCDGLKIMAGMMSESSALLRSRKDLIAEVYKYFESLSDIATEISIAVALVNMCNCLMQHSPSFGEQCKERQAKMAYAFLCLEWNNEVHGARYKTAVKELLKIWLDNEADPLEVVNSVMEWLPKEVASFTSPRSRLSRLASISKSNFPLLLKQLFVSLLRGLNVSLSSAELDPERIQIWLTAAVCLEKLSNICKSNRNNVYLVLFLRYTTMLYQVLLTSGMKLLEANIKYQTEKVLNVIKNFQMSGRFMRDIFCSARKDNNVPLLKLIPIAKSRRERFIYRVKGLLTANNSISAFWMGNLLNKDLDGEEIATESLEDMTAGSDVTNANVSINDVESDAFKSDSDEIDDSE